MGSFIPASRHQARSHGFLFAVADGVGGYDLGEVASATAVKVLTGEFAKAQAGTMLISLLPRLIQHANAAVQIEERNSFPYITEQRNFQQQQMKPHLYHQIRGGLERQSYSLISH